MRVALFHDELAPDAAPDERDVLVQMDAIGGALSELGHETIRVPCTLDLARAARDLRAATPDVVFNLVESIAGRGSLIALAPLMLDSLGLPFTGCPARSTFSTSCKPLSKQALAGARIPTPAWHTLEQLRAGAPIEPGRFILKSSWEHASRGLDDASIVEARTAADLAAALERRLPDLAGEGFAESFIDGREFNLSLLCRRILPPAEITFEGFKPGQPRIVGYRAKWEEASMEYTHTPRCFEFPPEDRPLLTALADTATDCWRLFGLRGYARVDFRVDAAGTPWVLEINSNPCLSPDAGFAAAVDQAGVTYTAAIDQILRDATAPHP